jgi:hypothetical protein
MLKFSNRKKKLKIKRTKCYEGKYRDFKKILEHSMFNNMAWNLHDKIII